MKLDRNTTTNGRGKYALVKMRELTRLEAANSFSASTAVVSLAKRGIVDVGDTPDTEFFVIRLRDKYAFPALAAYATAAAHDDPEYGKEIAELAKKAMFHPSPKIPD